MSESHKFRREFRGFNREDVVSYIEYMNKKYGSTINQLKTENKALKDELEALRAGSAAPQPAEVISTDSELEAYRRAEQVERNARERSQQIYQQVTAALAEATTQVDGAASQFTELADRVNAQICALQTAVDSSKNALQDAASAMYAIRPEKTEE